MNVDLDIEKLIALKMTSTEYCILNLIFNQKCESLLELFNLELIKEEDLKRLQKLGYLKLLYKDDVDFKQITLREKATILFNVNLTDKFNTLWVNYPFKVPNGKGGYRPLRAHGIGGTEYKQLNNKWLKIVKGKPSLPDIMLKALDKQLKDCRGDLQYMQQLSVWLNQATWEKFMDFDTNDDIKTTTEGV